MTLMLLSGPAEEPVTLAEARAHLRLDGADEDALLSAFITAARAVLEGETRRAFVTQNWRLLLDEWPGRELILPLAPIAAVTAVTVDGAGALDATLYETALAGDGPRLVAAGAWPAPSRRVAGIAVDFTAGYGSAADVPTPLKQAVLLLAAHWFDRREPAGLGDGPAELPPAVKALAAPYRRVRL
ncbi:MAG: head-tail connector protein [Parvibaculum sp.]|uniref:head-tail connector protein n=1 Tax=Parvibaculum sp. TaxID=2024848 RepID=UPI0025DEF363|nr:head-tail connector protein [Parvibaculum sp.]MCE9650579.1 head-tail connector protein [Parvibaculum sp.]